MRRRGVHRDIRWRGSGPKGPPRTVRLIQIGLNRFGLLVVVLPSRHAATPQRKLFFNLLDRELVGSRLSTLALYPARDSRPDLGGT
jgi:hypothetical protein